MKLQDVNIDGQVFKVQEGMSFIQQNQFMELIEDFIDFSKADTIRDKIENETMTFGDLSNILKDGVKLTKFTAELATFCLMNFVRNPEITKETLNDPDDPNVENYAILGQKLVELSIKYIGKLALLKKTPMK
jgi:hypothetical protein